MTPTLPPPMPGSRRFKSEEPLVQHMAMEILEGLREYIATDYPTCDMPTLARAIDMVQWELIEMWLSQNSGVFEK